MTSTDLRLRPATTDDATALAAFAERVFRDTFGSHNTAEDMAMYCSAAFAIDRVQRELGDPDRQTVLASTGDALVGYAQLRAGRPPACVIGEAPLEVLRFYVDGAWQGRGVASSVMAEVIEAAQQRGARTLYLAVWEHNQRAIGFYAKHGFAKIGSVPFVLGTDRQRDDVMVRTVVAVPGVAE